MGFLCAIHGFFVFDPLVRYAPSMGFSCAIHRFFAFDPLVRKAPSLRKMQRDFMKDVAGDCSCWMKKAEKTKKNCKRFGGMKKMFYLCNRKRGNGALDEWLSQRSAKPSTAVRIRQAPHNLQKCDPSLRQLRRGSFSFIKLLIYILSP